MSACRERIIQYAKGAYFKRGKFPSVREVQTKFKISSREFYKLFPNGVTELYELAGAKTGDAVRDKSEELKRNIISKKENVDLFHEINMTMYKLLKLYYSMPNDPEIFSETLTGLEICQDFKKLISEGTNVEEVRRLWESCSGTLERIVHTLEERKIWERTLEIRAQKVAERLIDIMIRGRIIQVKD